MKTLFWILVALLWCIPEVLITLFTHKPTKVGLFLIEKIRVK
jgi:hypothetical protein